MRVIVLLVGAALLAWFAACAGAGSTSGITTITGIVVRAETLTTGHGCGDKAEQLFKYGIVVFGKNPGDDRFEVPIAGNVYDCFTDGTFVRLPYVNGSNDYR